MGSYATSDATARLKVKYNIYSIIRLSLLMLLIVSEDPFQTMQLEVVGLRFKSQSVRVIVQRHLIKGHTCLRWLS